MMGHPGGEKHTRYLIELAFLEKGTKWLDMGAGDGAGVRLLRSLGYLAEGIDTEPRGKEVRRGDYRKCPWQDDFFDGILSQCSFYVGGDVPGALTEAARLLHKGGKLVFSDVTENVVQLLSDARKAGFAVRHIEDLTEEWKEYYLEALWTQENVCLPQGKKFSYVLFVCEKIN